MLQAIVSDYMETLFSDRAIEIYPTMHILAYFVYVLLDDKTLSFVALLLNSSILHSMAQSPDTETLVEEIRKYECLTQKAVSSPSFLM